MKKTYKLENLCCANCAASIEDAISKLPDVKNVRLAFLFQKMVVEADEIKFPVLTQQIRAICKKIEPNCEVK